VYTKSSVWVYSERCVYGAVFECTGRCVWVYNKSSVWVCVCELQWGYWVCQWFPLCLSFRSIFSYISVASESSSRATHTHTHTQTHKQNFLQLIFTEVTFTRFFENKLLFKGAGDIWRMVRRGFILLCSLISRKWRMRWFVFVFLTVAAVLRFKLPEISRHAGKHWINALLLHFTALNKPEDGVNER